MDRNDNGNAVAVSDLESLSARRAWIEIAGSLDDILAGVVALRKESVDRNITRGQLPTPEPPSLSARRAWIEMANPKNRKRRSKKSLSARRAWIEMTQCKL